jgi:hypothetical protein
MRGEKLTISGIEESGFIMEQSEQELAVSSGLSFSKKRGR